MKLEFIVLLNLLVLSTASDVKAPTHQYKNGDSQVFVFDDFIPPALGNTFKNYLTRYVKYAYYYPDPYEKDSFDADPGNLHWKAYMSPSQLIKMRFWKPLRDAYKSLPEEITQGKRFLPYEVFGTLMQRGDFPIAFQGDKDVKDKIFMRIFLTDGIDKHAYSDQAFYDNEDEIFTSVQPRHGRIVVWTGNVSTLFRPPSMGYEYVEYSLFVKLTADEELFRGGVDTFEAKVEKRLEYSKQPFPLKNHMNIIDFDKLNISEHVLAKYYDRNGEVIAFFDDLFPKEMVDSVRSYYTHFETNFGGNKYDPGTVETHDNVQWIMQLRPETVLNTPYWKVISKLSEYLSNSTDWFPYDVSCNLIQHTHHTRIHIDCVHEEFEYTFLMYLNPDWTEDKYAETTFYQYDEETFKTGNIAKMETVGKIGYDFIAGVIPKFGRVALFRNLIPHSARPPAPSFLAARYTFLVKVSESMRQAKAKMLHEALDYKTDDIPEDPKYEGLRQADYAPYLTDENREWVEEQLALMRKTKADGQRAEKQMLEEVLLPQKFRTENKE